MPAFLIIAVAVLPWPAAPRSAMQEQPAATEDKLEAARRDFNDSARDYRTATQSFPRAQIAGLFGFRPVMFFQAHPTETA